MMVVYRWIINTECNKLFCYTVVWVIFVYHILNKIDSVLAHPLGLAQEIKLKKSLGCNNVFNDP